jgi:hypothetical protein
VLEGILAAKRAAVANSLIPDHLRDGALLDLGCGVTPRFLLGTRFSRRVGIDPHLDLRDDRPGMELLRHDITSTPWPFADGQFAAITMLAVLEHLRQE